MKRDLMEGREITELTRDMIQETKGQDGGESVDKSDASLVDISGLALPDDSNSRNSNKK